MRPITFAKSLLLFAACCASLLISAQAPAAPAPVQSSSSDYSVYLLIAFACILLVTIAILGQVLIRLTIYAYQSKSKLVKSVLLLLMLSVGGHSLIAQDAAAAAPSAAPVAHAASSAFSTDFIMALTVILTEVFVIVIMLIRIWALINVISPKSETVKQNRFELPKWFDRFNESVAIEHEKDIMLDHNYDGIRELDNQLPPWWKYGFLLTILWAVCYFSYYHVFASAPLSAGEYENEMTQAKIAKDEYMKTAKNNVDENTVVYDKSYLADGQKIFTENCVACHGSKGEGGVGPNLTDNYWLHGGKINDIFKTIKYGWPANGMKSWQSDFSAIQIAQVTSYVKSLNGTNPENPKAPQGDLYNETGGASANTPATTSTAGKDSLSK